MSGVVTSSATRPPLRSFIARALLDLAREAGQPDALPWLVTDSPSRREWWRDLADAPRTPADDDRSIAELARMLQLTPLETLATAFLRAVEDESAIARAVEVLQNPYPGSRPMVGLVATALAPLTTSARDAISALTSGRAMASGAFTYRDADAPLAERRLALAPCVFQALRDNDGIVPNVGVEAGPRVAFSAAVTAEITRHGTVLREYGRALVMRSVSPVESRAACAVVAGALGCRVAFIDGDPGPGLGAWLSLRKLVPVFTCQVAPGERHKVSTPVGYRGPVLIAAGHDGIIELDGGVVPSYRVAVPAIAEREQLWAASVESNELAQQLAIEHRYGASRIAELATEARRLAHLEGKSQIEHSHVRDAAWTSETGGIEGLAEPIRDRVPDHALVTPPVLTRDLAHLVARCKAREGLGAGLGPAIAARMRPGVRALFVGPSGTGKTFAASWLATRLGKPLYRVDLAATTSKYIGETEKNLATLLDRAEQQDVILLFDEADSMFGKRTDVKDSTDRFANAQTNYLLQRIENLDGIVVLTSNSRSRIDAAFKRRLDFVLEFPLPGPEERRDLWRAHLGTSHSLDAAAINQLAATVDLVGGHIRNAVLAAAVLARGARRAIDLDDVIEGVLIEYRKLGRSAPADLQVRRRS